MNILFINNNPCNPVEGGIERVTDILTKELLKRGYCVYYLCDKVINPKLLDYTFPVPQFQLPEEGRYKNPENINFYKRLLKDLNIDVVVNQRALGGWYNDILPITDAKLISVMHNRADAHIIEYRHNLISKTTPPFLNLKRLIKFSLYPIISSYWHGKLIKDTVSLYKDLAEYSDAIVTLSEKDVEIVKSFIGMTHRTKILSIPNPNSFEHVTYLPNDKEKVILYVGRLKKSDKNPMRLLKVWKLIYKKHPDWNLKFVGDGDEMQKMKCYIEKNRLKNVILEGRKSNVVYYFQRAAFIVLVSNFEGRPMVLTEGMQFGCIPVTFNNYGAATEIIDDNINGVLIQPFNIRNYSSRLSELMHDGSRRQKMSNNAREKVKMFSVGNVVDRWEALLKSL